MSESQFRLCKKSACGWYGLVEECFKPRLLHPEIYLCPDCGGIVGALEGMLPFAVLGTSYAAQVSCLKEAHEIVIQQNQGAVYKLLWDYTPYITNPSRLAEVTIACTCDQCTPSLGQKSEV